MHLIFQISSGAHNNIIKVSFVLIIHHDGFQEEFEVSGQNLGVVSIYKYLGATISDEGSKPEDLFRTPQTMGTMAKLKPIIWRDGNISFK